MSVPEALVIICTMSAGWDWPAFACQCKLKTLKAPEPETDRTPRPLKPEPLAASIGPANVHRHFEIESQTFCRKPMNMKRATKVTDTRSPYCTSFFSKILGSSGNASRVTLGVLPQSCKRDGN